jgi:hypothetical protein
VTLRARLHDNSTLLGAVLENRYQIDSFLDSDLTGCLYIGHELVTDQAVTIKILDDVPTGDPACKELPGAVEGIEITRFFDSGQDPKWGAFRVMELVVGPSIHQRIQSQGTLSPYEGFGLFQSLLEMVATWPPHMEPSFAWSPGALVFAKNDDGEEQIRLRDWGEPAWFLQERSDSESEPRLKAKSLSENYPDYHGDMFGASVLIWYCLTGVTPEQLIEDSRNHSRIASFLCPQMPAPWLSLFDKALASDPNERFSSLEDMQAALQEIINEHQQDDSELWLEPFPIAPTKRDSNPPTTPIPDVSPSPDAERLEQTLTPVVKPDFLHSNRKRNQLIMGIMGGIIVLLCVVVIAAQGKVYNGLFARKQPSSHPALSGSARVQQAETLLAKAHRALALKQWKQAGQLYTSVLQTLSQPQAKSRDASLYGEAMLGIGDVKVQELSTIKLTPRSSSFASQPVLQVHAVIAKTLPYYGGLSRLGFPDLIECGNVRIAKAREKGAQVFLQQPNFHTVTLAHAYLGQAAGLYSSVAQGMFKGSALNPCRKEAQSRLPLVQKAIAGLPRLVPAGSSAPLPSVSSAPISSVNPAASVSGKPPSRTPTTPR